MVHLRKKLGIGVETNRPGVLSVPILGLPAPKVNPTMKLRRSDNRMNRKYLLRISPHFVAASFKHQIESFIFLAASKLKPP
jgi:hypothetical protein